MCKEVYLIIIIRSVLCILIMYHNSFLAAMRDVLLAFERPEHQTRMLEIEQEAGSDLVKRLQDRLPFAAEIQQEVIKSHGFSDDGAGIPTQVIYQSN